MARAALKVCEHRVPIDAYCVRCAESPKAARPGATMDGKRQEGDGSQSNSGAAVAHFSAEEAEEYTQSLGQILGGGWRQVEWAQRVGVPAALGLSTREWVETRLGGYVKMNKADRRKALTSPELKALPNRQAAEILGVDEITVRRDKDATNVAPEATHPASLLGLGEADATNVAPESTTEEQRRLRKERDGKADAKRLDRTRREDAVTDVPEPDIREGRLAVALADVTDADLIFTDPPYPREFLPAWSELASWAAEALKPGALLVAYSGQYHLPDVIARLSAHLTYQWLGWISTTGPHVAVHQRPVMSGGKPLLVFSRGDLVEPFRSRRFYDVSSSEGRTRELHTWEQDEAPAAYYIEALTERGELVVDPFLGSGTFAVVASRLGRRFIGCDADAQAVATTRERLAA